MRLLVGYRVRDPWRLRDGIHGSGEFCLDLQRQAAGSVGLLEEGGGVRGFEEPCATGSGAGAGAGATLVRGDQLASNN